MRKLNFKLAISPRCELKLAITPRLPFSLGVSYVFKMTLAIRQKIGLLLGL